MTKEHGLVGKYLKLVLLKTKVFTELQKSFAEQVGKGAVEVKP